MVWTNENVEWGHIDQSGTRNLTSRSIIVPTRHCLYQIFWKGKMKTLSGFIIGEDGSFEDAIIANYVLPIPKCGFFGSCCKILDDALVCFGQPFGKNP